MNKEKTINFTGTIIIFFVLLFLFFKFGPKIPLSIISQEKGEPLVVTGEGKTFVVPDIAYATFGIEETGTSLKETENSVNTKSKNLTDALKKHGIEEKNIKTSSYNIYPDYNYEKEPRNITGYRVSVRYTVKIENFDKINEVISKATQMGANSVGNISFEVNDETKNEKLQEAREIAVKEAKDKAEGLAKAAGISLGKIINITESEGGQEYDLYALPLAGGGGEPETKANIEPGETEISVIVSLSFEIR